MPGTLNVCMSGEGDLVVAIESLSNHDDDGNKNPTNLHIWQWKTVFLHALHVHFSFFDILETFSFFLRRQMTCSAVVWTTWAYIWWQMFNFVFSCPKRWFQFNSRTVRTHFSRITWMTLNNWKMITETQVTFLDNVLTSVEVAFA